MLKLYSTKRGTLHLTQKLPEIGVYLRQVGGSEVESITIWSATLVSTQNPPEIGVYLRQAGGAEVESITIGSATRVSTQNPPEGRALDAGSVVITITEVACSAYDRLWRD